jgi:uncharacterized protein YndB with AHSA1/START domain
VARNETYIAAPPERVFAVLADPDAYGYWVVGSDRIRGADPGFPAVGTRFHHTVGFGPLKVSDHSEVIDAHPPYRLELKAKARPLGTARVVMLMQPRGEGTHVTMIEDAGDLLTRLVFNPLTHLLVRGRNVESLRRLKELAEHPERMATAPTG